MFPILLVVLAADPVPTPPVFTTHIAGKEAVTGPLTALGAKWAAKVGDADIPAGDLIALARVGVPRGGYPIGLQLLLAGGDRIPGKIVGGDDLAVTFEPIVTATANAAWRVPLASIRVAWLIDPPTDTPADIGRYAWLSPEGKTDILLARTGDVRAGEISRFDGATLTFTPAGGKPAAVQLDRLEAVAFNPSLVAARKPKGAVARLVARSGARVTLASATLTGDRVRGTTPFGAVLDIPLAEVVALDILGGKATYLADLSPKAETVGFAGPGRPWAANLTTAGTPLRLERPAGVEQYDAGIGVRPRTVLTYPLAGRYRRLEAVVGLDYGTGRRGAAAVRIRVDGKDQPLPELAALTAAAVAVPVSVPVVGAKEMQIVVDFGPAGGVQADVNFANARLVE